MALLPRPLALLPAAYAFDCTIARQPATADGVDINGGGFTPLENNSGSGPRTHGGFITLTTGALGGSCPRPAQPTSKRLA